MTQHGSTQHDYEPQPEAPDLGASVQLETGGSLVGPPADADPLDAGYVPPDRPYGLDDDSVTGMRAGETLEDRLARERPEDDDPDDPDRSGRLTIDGEGAALETSDATAGFDEGVDGGAASAEEAAVHEIDGTLPLDAERPVDDEVDDVPPLDAERPVALPDEPGDATRG